MLLSIKLIAHGSVQGVGFRSFVIGIAEELALTGYARNLPGGTVEIAAEGEKEKIDEFVKRVEVKHPVGIHVTNLETIEKREIKEKSFASFGVAY